MLFSHRLSDGNDEHSSLPMPPLERVVTSFTHEQYQRITDGRMSSALGELIALNVMVRTVMDVAPNELVEGRTIHYHRDSRAASDAMKRMYSHELGMADMILQTYAMMLQRGARIVYTWVPREDNTAAD